MRLVLIIYFGMLEKETTSYNTSTFLYFLLVLWCFNAPKAKDKVRDSLED